MVMYESADDDVSISAVVVDAAGSSVSPSLDACPQGGVEIIPGSGGGHVGESAKADTQITDVKTAAASSFCSFFMVSP